jgi:hypothetical protein
VQWQALVQRVRDQLALALVERTTPLPPSSAAVVDVRHRSRSDRVVPE